MMSQHGASGLRSRRRLPRLAIVRRLAAGVPPERVGEGTGLEPHEIEAILTERGLQRAVAAYRELLATPPEARLKRLYELALQVLEQALAEGCRLTLVYMLREAGAGRDPVAWLAARIHQRLEAAPPPAAPSESAPEPGPPEGAAARGPDPFDAQAWRTAARLRREILAEAGLAAAELPPPAAPPGPEPRDSLDYIDPLADPLGAAVHRLHRAADRRHLEQRRAAMAPPEPPEPPPAPAPPAAEPEPPPAAPEQTGGAAAELAQALMGPELQTAFVDELLRLPPAILERLATFSADDMNRLFAELTRRELLCLLHEAEQAARPRDGPVGG
jgi:hypothetical protein